MGQVPMRILIVEDEAPLRNGLLKLLREEGYAADGAVNGEEGLHKAMECDYDAIVLDYLMPVMDGREMLRRLRHTKRTPVMMLTAAAHTVRSNVTSTTPQTDPRMRIACPFERTLLYDGMRPS